jgi:hypothetical protein
VNFLQPTHNGSYYICIQAYFDIFLLKEHFCLVHPYKYNLLVKNTFVPFLFPEAWVGEVEWLGD